MTTTNAGELQALLDDLVAKVTGADRAVLLSAEGLPVGRSRAMSAEDAEHLSAVASAFQSLARGTGRHFGGGDVRQTVVEMDQAFLVVTAAGHGACLALLATPEADLGSMAYELTAMVKRIGEAAKVGEMLAAAPRRPAAVPVAKRAT